MVRRNIAVFCVAWQVIHVQTVVRADQVLDLGNLDQYSSNDNGPALGGNTLWISGREGQDITMALSPDMQGQVTNSLGACKNEEDQCFQVITNLLSSSDLQIDGELDRRGFAQFLSKTFKKIRLPIMMFTAILIAKWKEKQGDSQMDLTHKFNLPTVYATQVATILDGNPLTVSAGGSAVIVVTPTPPPMIITESVSPAVTSVSTAIAGYSPGDFMFTMDPGFASRLGEVMRRTTQCDEGRAFDSGNPAGKRDGTTYGGAVCGAIGALSMAAPGGLFHDVMLINAPRFVFTAGQVAAAAQVVVDFARDYASLLDVPADVAENMAQLFFALAVDTSVDNVPLGEKNPIRASIISGTVTAPPTTTTSACSSASACEAKCQMKGVYMFVCQTSCSTVTGCATATEDGEDGEQNINTVTTVPYAGPFRASTVPTTTATAQPHPTCSMDEPAGLQWDVFYGAKYNVADPFCDEVGKNQQSALSWIVDIRGNMVPQRQVRSPPVTPDTYKDYKVGLSWTPKQGFNAASCTRDCKSTYQSIAQTPCGHTGGQSNIVAKNGSWDIGCGTYAWSILKPDPPPDPVPTKVPLAVGPQSCNSESNFRGHADVTGGDVSLGAAAIWYQMPVKMTAKSTRWTPPKPPYGRSGYELKFAVEWKPGCTTEVEEQVVRDPLGDTSNVYYSLFLNNWIDCNNGGVGGWINAGCLTYSFSP